MTEPLIVYFDYKSPYAYLAKEPARALASEFGLSIDWRPYTLRIPEYLGDVETRNAHQWRRVRYSYMDARRLANERGLIVYGPKKIFDSALSHIGALYAKAAGAEVFDRYHDAVFERFFRRELDIENEGAILAVLDEVGADADSFAGWAAEEGRAAYERGLDAAEEELGIFGVPTFVIGEEIWWGGDRIPQVRERLVRMQSEAS